MVVGFLQGGSKIDPMMELVKKGNEMIKQTNGLLTKVVNAIERCEVRTTTENILGDTQKVL